MCRGLGERRQLSLLEKKQTLPQPHCYLIGFRFSYASRSLRTAGQLVPTENDFIRGDVSAGAEVDFSSLRFLRVRWKIRCGIPAISSTLDSPVRDRELVKKKLAWIPNPRALLSSGEKKTRFFFAPEASSTALAKNRENPLRFSCDGERTPSIRNSYANLSDSSQQFQRRAG